MESLSLLTIVSDDDAGGRDDLAGIVLTVELAKTGPFALRRWVSYMG